MSSGLFIRAMPAKYQTTLSEPDVRFDAHCGLKSDIAPCPFRASYIAANCVSLDHLVERAALMGRVTLHGLDQVGDQVVTSSLGIPVAADSCDAMLAASLNVELPMNVKLPKGIGISSIAHSMNAPRLERSYSTTTVIFLTACTCD